MTIDDACEGFHLVSRLEPVVQIPQKREDEVVYCFYRFVGGKLVTDDPAAVIKEYDKSTRVYRQYAKLVDQVKMAGI